MRKFKVTRVGDGVYAFAERTLEDLHAEGWVLMCEPIHNSKSSCMMFYHYRDEPKSEGPYREMPTSS